MIGTAIIRNVVVVLCALGSMALSWDASAQSAVRPLPPYLRDISDEVGALSDKEGQALAGMIADLQRERGVRLIIVIAETTAPESIEDYTKRLSGDWLARRPPLYGEERVFAVVDTTDRAVRIATGEKMAPLIDQISKSQFMTDLLPLFSRHEYFQALRIIVERLSQAIMQRGSI
jgi:uncharacterized protein